tara:strand:+ start:360 stop:1412 length:1053 start_codon:yes stop_codon:yes gene_type:complete
MPKNNFWRNKKVFITGHTGFKGCWLAIILLNFGAKVKGYSLKPERVSLYNDVNLSRKIKSKYGDIRNFNNLKKEINNFKPEIFFHLAAQPLVLDSYKDPYNTFDTNILGTLNVLECIRNQKSIKSSIIVTTDKCYQNNEKKKTFKETDSLGGKDPYSWSKVCAEYLTETYLKKFLCINKSNIATVRGGNVIGAGDYGKNRIVPDIIESIKNNKIVKIRNPQSIRPWQHVIDCLTGYINLSQKLYSNKKYCGSWNFGPKINKIYTVKEITKKIITMCKYEKKYKVVKDKSKKEAKFLLLNSKKANKYLNWKPIIDIDESLRHTTEWHLKIKKNEKYESIKSQIIYYFSKIS